MRENPSITYAELTSSLGINTSAVQKLVKRIFPPPPGLSGDPYYMGSYNIVVFLTICISYANNCFTL